MTLTNENVRVGKPSRAYKKSLTTLSQKHYTQLERACVQAYLTGQTYVTIRVPYVVEFPEDFPKRLKRVKVPGTKVDEITLSAKGLLRWLNKRGYSSITSEDIRIMLITFTIQNKELLNELES